MAGMGNDLPVEATLLSLIHHQDTEDTERRGYR